MTDRSNVRLRRIGARSVFVLFFVLYGFVGLVVGGLLFGASRVEVLPAVSMTALDRLGAWSLLLFPAGYGLLGGFVGAVAAMLYNFAATFTGGIRLELTGLEVGPAKRSVPGGAAAPERDAEGPSEGDEEEAQAKIASDEPADPSPA